MKKITRKFLSILLTVCMVVGLAPIALPSADAAANAYTKPVGETFQKYTGRFMDSNYGLGSDYLFLIKEDGKYYAMQEVPSSNDSRLTIPAVDVTDWVNPDGTVTIPDDTKNVAFLRYESVPYDNEGNDDFYISINGGPKRFTSVNKREYGDTRVENYPYDILNEWMEFKIVESTNYYPDEISWEKFNGTDHGMIDVTVMRTVYEGNNSKYKFRHYYVEVQDDGLGGKVMGFHAMGEDNLEPASTDVETYMYYLPCRHQFQIDHVAKDDPTCMEKGCDEYWYCNGCKRYFSDAELTKPFKSYLAPDGMNQPIIPATGHVWDEDGCQNCGRDIPVYTKVTNIEQLLSLSENTSFILVGKSGDDTYVLDAGDQDTLKKTIDANSDDYPDIIEIDENKDGTPDCMEIDEDSNGVWDYLETNTYDTTYDEIDWYDYQFYWDDLEYELLPDNVYSGNAYDGGIMGASKITPNADGTISVMGKNALEFQMTRMTTDEEINDDLDNYDTDEIKASVDKELQNNFMINIPNLWLQPYFCFTDRRYLEERPDMGDQTMYNFYFYDDIKDMTIEVEQWDDAQGDFVTKDINVLPEDSMFSEGCVLAYSITDMYGGIYNPWSPEENFDKSLRLRKVNGNVDFVGGSHIYDFEQGCNVELFNGEQFCIYLYASEGEDPCEHEWNNGEVTKDPTEEAEGETTYTCTICGDTKTEPIDKLEHKHDYGDFITDTESDDKHYKECRCNDKVYENCIWDSGVISKNPTETEEGIKTFTCTVCERTKNEPIDKLPHSTHIFGDWVPNDNDTHISYCQIEDCTVSKTETHKWDDGTVIQAPNCGVSGQIKYTCIEPTCSHEKFDDIPALEHEWSDYTDNGDGTHSRTCSNPECLVGTETESHKWSEWAELDDGSLERKCTAEGCEASEFLSLVNDVVNTTLPSNNALAADLINSEIDLINSVFDEEDFEAAAADDTISVYLEVTDISNTVSPTDASACENAASGSQIGMYLDIELLKKIGDEAPENVTETNGKVKITITIPDELINTDNSVNRTYQIVRVHEGYAEIISGVFDPETKTFTFETDKFSTYAIAYKDSKISYGSSTDNTEYVVSIDRILNGNVDADIYQCVRGKIVTLTVTPDQGYTLESITVTDKNGKEIEFKNKGNGIYTFRMPSSDVTISASFMEDNTMLNFFVDVPADSYYYDAVLWAVMNDITNGISETEFGPDVNCTRAQMVTFLWRASGCPEPELASAGFEDVSIDSYYSKAVLWAVENGITNGLTETTFGPDENCTRAQMATFLSRMENGSAEGKNMPFTDVSGNAYYSDAVLWAVENGITNGLTETTFGPDENCTRAQMVTFLYRLMN